MASAVIIPAHLPAGLEALRQRGVGDAAGGLPAHLTMLYPFLERDELDPAVERAIAAVARRHSPIPYRMTGPHRWPDAIYAGIDPGRPFVRLQADLAAAFPAWPIYGEPPGFAFVPHITVAEGAAADDPRMMADVAWTALPSDAIGSRIDVISTAGDRWEVVWSLPLGRRAGRRRG